MSLPVLSELCCYKYGDDRSCVAVVEDSIQVMCCTDSPCSPEAMLLHAGAMHQVDMRYHSLVVGTHTAGLVRDTDFLDPITMDKPEGVWSLCYDTTKTVACLKSLAWPGYFFLTQVKHCMDISTS